MNPWLVVGSAWKPATGWQPQDARVQITSLAGGRVFFRDTTGHRSSDELDLSEDVFLDSYEPEGDRLDTATPSLFEE